MASEIRNWADRHGGCRTIFTVERTLPGIRRQLRRAELAVIDATEDPAQASDAFLQSIGVLRADSVAVYTEKMHDGLEILVRTLGAPLLLGPMSMEDWDEYLEHKFPTLIPLVTAGASMYPDEEEITLNFKDKAANNIVYYKPIAG